jgi:4'-phosphopantetheinyl transferase
VRRVLIGDDAEVLVAVDDAGRVLARHPCDPADAEGAAPLAPWRAREFLAARALLRSVLAELEPAAHGARIATRPGGQPFLPQWPQLAVSLSHDGTLVGAAAGRCARVGVDVQAPPAATHPGLLRRCLREHLRLLDPLDARARADVLARVWSVQEACVKADGTGIAGRPWAIDVPPGGRTGRWNDITWLSLPDLWPAPAAVAWRAHPTGTERLEAA